jgi:hypothetical protein
VDGHAGLVAQPLVEAAQQGAAAGQDDAAVHDVAGQLGRGLVEGGADRVDDRADLALVGSGDDEEGVGDGELLGDVEGDDLLALLLPAGAGGGDDELEGVVGGGHAAPVGPVSPASWAGG